MGRWEMRILGIAVLGVGLAGCAGSPVGDAIAGPEKLAAQDDAYCQSIGLRFGTPDYANCRMITGQQRQQGHQAAMQRMSTALSDMSTNMRVPSSGLQSRCVSRQVGSQVVTDCN